MRYSALLGNPVEHSISPMLFDELSKTAGLEYAHLKIKVLSRKDLGKTLSCLRKLGFCGTNITLPYKLDIIKELDEISPEAKKIGAVNTVVFSEKRTIGYNTDANGAILAIESKLKFVEDKDTILILGSGGAARAVAYELYKKCKNITVLNRDIKEARALSDNFSGNRNKIIVCPLNNENIRKGLLESNIIVNATPVGMYPETEGEIIGGDVFKSVGNLNGKFFFDVIFNPYKTNFLKMAEKSGAKVCSGTYMMIYQAISAFQLWTGIKLKKIDIEVINNKLVKSLTKQHE